MRALLLSMLFISAVYSQDSLSEIRSSLLFSQAKETTRGIFFIGVGVAALTATICDVTIKRDYSSTIGGVEYKGSVKNDWAYLHTTTTILSSGFILGGTMDLINPFRYPNKKPLVPIERAQRGHKEGTKR